MSSAMSLDWFKFFPRWTAEEGAGYNLSQVKTNKRSQDLRQKNKG